MEPNAVVVSGPNFLSFNLVNNLLSKHCRVSVVTKEKEGWKKFLVNETALLKIVGIEDTPSLTDYCFVIEGVDPQNEQLDIKEKKKVFDFIKATDPKTVIVLPYIDSHKTERTSAQILDLFLQSSSPNINLIYAGELYGAGMNLFSAGFVSYTFSGLLSGKIDVPSYDFICFPTYVNSLVEYLVRGIFSYGFEKRRIVFAEKVSAYDFLRKVQRIAPWAIFERNVSFKKPTNALVFDFKSFELTDQSIAETVNWLRVLPKAEPGLHRVEVSRAQEVKTKIRKRLESVRFPSLGIKRKIKAPKVLRKKVLIISIFVFLWTLSFPFFSLFASGVAIRAAYKSFLTAEAEKTKKFLEISGFFSGFARGQLNILSKTPVIGRAFNFPYKASLVLQEAIVLGKTGLSTYSDVKQVVDGIVSDRDYNLPLISERTFLTLDTIYRDSSFLEAEIQDIRSLAVGVFPQIRNLDAFRGYILALGNLTRRLPFLLGSETKKTYLVLFQNNTELRPTGGFIGSFALVTFDKGKLVDTSVFDVYEADGQLRGHIEPPAAIKNYLGEANWWMRDSNWDPDFKVSAQRAQWFLEKEFDREVDGVIGVDLQVVKEILKQTGPLNLGDVNMVVDYKNMYEKIQYEVESTFFPGSKKKSTILTSLEKAILGKLSSLTSSPQLGLSMFSLLRQKHIQVYLKDKDSQDAIESINFGGRVDPDSCGGNCSNIWFGVVDANLGVNKVNYYVQRELDFRVNVKPTNIDNQLTVKITNSSNQNSPLAGSYKNYLRVLAPSQSYFDKVTEVGSDGTKNLPPEVVQVNGHVEAGVLVSVAPGETKTFVFSWNLAQSADFSKEGVAQFYLRKQAGTVSDPISININLPENKIYTLDSAGPFALTGSHGVSYNTNLTTDIAGRISWK